MIAAATLDLRLPSLPDPLTGMHAIVAAGFVVLGVVLALRGMRLSRWLMMIAGLVAGLVLAGPLAAKMPNISVAIVRIVLAGTLAIIAFISARLWVALLAGALSGSAAVIWLLSGGSPQYQPADMEKLTHSQTTDLMLWACELHKNAGIYVLALAKNQMWLPLALIGLAVLIPLVFAIIAKKLLTIVITSILGAAMVMVGAVILTAYFKHISGAESLIVSKSGLIVLGGMAALGAAFQFVTSYLKRKRIPSAEPDDDR